jgi:hypothetical protein
MLGDMMDRLRDVVLFVAGIVALGTLIMAAYEGFNNRVPSAVFLGTLGVVCTFMVFLPKIEVFKVWGVEARMREVKETLSEAQVLTSKLNKLAAINARVSYLLMAWGNRMDGPTAAEKQSLLDEVDKQLSEMGMKPEERASIVKPYIQLIGTDLYFIYVQVMERLSKVKNAEVMKAYETNKNETTLAAAQKFSDEVGKWMASKGGGPYGDVNGYNFESTMRRAIPHGWLSVQDQETAKHFAEQLIEMFKGCEKKGGATPETTAFIDKYRDLGGIDSKLKELFGVSYN